MGVAHVFEQYVGGYFVQANVICRWICKLRSFLNQDFTELQCMQTVDRGAFFQFFFRSIHYCHSSKSTGKETGKNHLCARVNWRINEFNAGSSMIFMILFSLRYVQFMNDISVILAEVASTEQMSGSERSEIGINQRPVNQRINEFNACSSMIFIILFSLRFVVTYWHH